MATRRDSFKNLSEFGSIIENLDDYRSLPISTRVGDREVLSEKIHGMVNITASPNRITMSVGERYPVFGHRESLGYVIKELKARSCDVHGFVDTVGDRTFTRILFDGLIVKDKESNVELGVSFENPMDRKTRFKGYGYTFRLTCANGAGIKTMLPMMEINERHTSDMCIRVPVMIHDFIGQSLEQTNHMQNLIDSSMKVTVAFESPEQIFETLKVHFNGISDRHVKHIVENLEGEMTPTRWDLFNASNFVTSHYGIKPDVRSEIDRRAELFINPAIPFHPVKIEVKVVVPEILTRPVFVPDQTYLRFD